MKLKVLYLFAGNICTVVVRLSWWQEIRPGYLYNIEGHENADFIHIIFGRFFKWPGTEGGDRR